MSTAPALAITGSTGSVGGRVASELAAQGVALRLIARSPEKAPALPGAVAVRASYGDGAAARAALDGVETLFMVSAVESADRVGEHRTFLEAARAAGVQHVVYTSFFGASPTATFTLARDHALTEDMLRESGMGFTFLRDNFYLDFLTAIVGEDGVIRGPAGDGRLAAVARQDVARSAAAVLRDPAAHDGLTYDLTGPQSLSLAEAAAEISRVTGRAVSYHEETLDEAYASRAVWGAPDWQVDAWVSTYTAIAAGELDGPTDAVQRLTGRRPLSLTDILTTNGG